MFSDRNLHGITAGKIIGEGIPVREGEYMLKRKDIYYRNAATCFFVFLLLVMSGCASLSPAAGKIKEAGKDAVSGCKYLGEVTGTSKVGSESAVLYQTGKDNAKKDALEKAAQLGGTHIVWRPLIDARPIIATCDVYLCGETTK
jgi:hypothetical protein